MVMARLEVLKFDPYLSTVTYFNLKRIHRARANARYNISIQLEITVMTRTKKVVLVRPVIYEAT
tara:strand:+ start:434 stop:625 length:192 start_codon:yes stop_codon:yes gene_type:complete